MLFKQRKWKPTKKNYLIDFSMHDIGTGDVCNLLYYLYKKYGFVHITYTYKDGRFILSYCNDNPGYGMKQFFTDRTPSQVEELCLSLRGIKIDKYTSEHWDSGFHEFKVYYWKEVTDNECEEKES